MNEQTKKIYIIVCVTMIALTGVLVGLYFNEDSDNKIHEVILGIGDKITIADQTFILTMIDVNNEYFVFTHDLKYDNDLEIPLELDYLFYLEGLEFKIKRFSSNSITFTLTET